MADEIKTTFSFNLTKGNHIEQIDVAECKFTQTGVGSHKPVWDVGTSEEDLSVGDISTLGLLFVRNLDATNFVTIGPKSGTMVAFAKILPGKWGFIPLAPGITITAQADTAAVKLQVFISEL